MGVGATLILRVGIDEIVGQAEHQRSFDSRRLVEIGVTNASIARPVEVQNPWLSCTRVPLGHAKNEPPPADVAGYSRVMGIDE